MDMCIYHAKCYDGFTAAWVVHMLYPQADYVPAGYGDDPPDVTGKNVAIVDFSYPREVLERMHAQAASLVVLDHHKSAEAALQGLDYAVFNQNRSGAGMAWEYFMGDAPCPKLVLYVEDRDLWRFAMPNSREINAWIMSNDFAFDTWAQMAVALDDDAGRLAALAAGVALERKHLKDCNAVIQAALTEIDLLGHTVPTVNAPHMMASDIGHILANIPDVPFAVTYYDTLSERRYSLRSTDNGLDVSEIAKHFGGGGHRNAAGFAVPLQMAGNPHWLVSKAAQDDIAAAEAPTPPAPKTRSKKDVTS